MFSLWCQAEIMGVTDLQIWCLPFTSSHEDRLDVGYNSDPMSQLTLQLPDRLAADLASASKESNRQPDELVVELLGRAMAARRFRALRQKALAELGNRAPDTDEDAFRMLR